MKHIKHVIWIDQNNEKEENKGYLKQYSEELKDFSFTLVSSVQEGYSLLSKFHFEIIYIILSGRLAEEFLDIYEENLQNLTVLTLNIIFCFRGKYHELKKYANDPFYNPGGVVTEFEKVICFLKMDKNDKNDAQSINEQNKYNNLSYKTFTFISNSIENISLPIILKKFSSRFINEDEIEKFKRFLKKNYYNYLEENGLINFFDSKIKIPYYLFTKIFIRLYTIESPFYRDLNKALGNGYFSDFNQYIFTLYYGLNLKIIKDFHDESLYRGAYISTKELDEIIYSSYRLVLTNSFLSFAKDKSLAIEFMKYLNNNAPTLKKVLFVVNPLKQKNITVTNMNVKEFSYYSEESEVTFLPFSGFEIVNIEEGKEYITMYLNYLNKYEKKVIDYIDARSKDRVEVFLKELIKGSSSSIFKNLIPDKSIQLIGDYRNKKNVLWIDQYSRCRVYDNYIKKYSENLKNFYFERATTIKEAFSILSNYEFKMVHIIINDKLSKKFFSEYINEIKKLGVVTANIIFCDEVP